MLRCLRSNPERQQRSTLVEVVRSGTLLELDLLDCPVCCHALTNPIFQCDNGHIACSSCCVSLKKKCPSCTLPIGVYRNRMMEKLLEAISIVSTRSGNLLELDLLDCPVCCNALTNPIFQCDNGHIACSSCCVKLRNRCPSCTFPIGIYRNRMMERLVKAIIVPCPNSKHGCTDKFSYGKEVAHGKECSFALCYCPARGCNYAGLCNDLYRHYYDNHPRESYMCGKNRDAWMFLRDKIFVLQHYIGPLFVIQCFEEEQGVYVTVNCIAPCAPGVSEFSFQLSYSSYFGEKTMSFGLREMNRIQKVSFETPEKDFMFVPQYFMAGRPDLKMKICISEPEKKT